MLRRKLTAVANAASRNAATKSSAHPPPSYPAPNPALSLKSLKPAPSPSITHLPTSHFNFQGMTGGDIFHEMMRYHNVTHIFGYPGGAILPVFDAIYNSNQFQLILPRHEQGAGHMAEGYARVTGKPGVVLVTSGPGATNVITAMQDAQSDGTPLIVFSGQVPTTALGSDAFQEADVVGISRSCTKWNVMVRDIVELPRRINEAFEIACSGRPGAVLVDLPKDVTAATLTRPHQFHPSIPSLDKPHLRASRVATLAQFNENVDKVFQMIQQAQRPVIYAGQGVMWTKNGLGSHLLHRLATHAQIPVTTTLQGLGAFDEMDDALSLHMLGMHGSAYANYAIQSADLILAIGARFDDRVTGALSKFAPEARRASREGRGGIVQFEILPSQVDKVVKVDVAVEGDLEKGLIRLVPMLEAAPQIQRPKWLQEIASWKKNHPLAPSPPPTPQPTLATHADSETTDFESPLTPQEVLVELNKQLAQRMAQNEVVVTTGVGQHQMWAAQLLRWRHPRTFITSGGLGTMGFGLPAAIGAKVAFPGKVVIDVDGDASFSMTGMELATASEFGIGVKVLILNNEFQGMVKQWQDLFYDKRYSSTRMKNPDFVKLAEAMHCKGMRLHRRSQLSQIINEFLSYDNNLPVVLDARVCKKSHVYPMVPAGRGLDEMVLQDTRLL